MRDQHRIFIVPHSGAGEDTINMNIAQWAALLCFAALLTEQLGLNQVWSLTNICLSLFFTVYPNKPFKATYEKSEHLKSCQISFQKYVFKPIQAK